MCTEIARISCKTFFYTPAKRSLNQRTVGPLQILRREPLPQFLTDSYETWQRCVPWVADVQDTFFFSVPVVRCHGNGILWAKMRTNLALRTPPSVFDQFS